MKYKKKLNTQKIFPEIYQISFPVDELRLLERQANLIML